jgi:hypothetical protein
MKSAEETQRDKFKKFNDFDYIYHSKLKKSDPNIPSKVFNPIVWSFIETVVTRLLAKNPKIGYKPRERTDEQQALIMSSLFDYWFEKCNVYPIIVNWVKDALTYGTGIVKVDWYTSKPRKLLSYITDVNGDVQPQLDEMGQPIEKLATQESEVIDYDDPRIKNVNIYDFFVDPKATSMYDAKWVIHQYWASIEELEEQNDYSSQYGKPRYNRAALKRLKGTAESASDFERAKKQAAGIQVNYGKEERAKIWEMWEDDHLVVVADETETLTDDINPNWHGKKPFIRIVDSLNSGEFWGKGEIEPVEKSLHALNTTQNQRIVNVNRILSPMWKAKNTVDDDELQFIDNGIIHINDLTDVEIQSIPNVTGTAVQEQNLLVESMQRALGVTDYVTGIQTPGQTAAEVQIKTSEANQRFGHKVKLIEEMGFKPLGEFIYQLYQQFVTKEKIIRIMGQQGEQYIKVKPSDIVGDFDVVPESDSTLQVDQAQEFAKFMNLYPILAKYISTQVADPATGQIHQVGYLDEQEIVKELLVRSGETDPDRFWLKKESDGQQNGQQLPGEVPGQDPAGAGQFPQSFGAAAQGSTGLPQPMPNAGMEAPF